MKLGDVLKVSIIASFCAFALSGCAAVGTFKPTKFTPTLDQQNSRYSSLYSEIAQLTSSYAEQADKLGDSSSALNTVSTASAVATLAFAGFDAHPDNLLASTILGGTSGAASRTLTPGTRAQLRSKAVDALRCVASRADTLLDRQDQLASGVSLSSFRNDAIVSASWASVASATDGYEALDLWLYIFMSAGQAVPEPSDALVSAIASAQSSREKLAAGIKAQTISFDSMSRAIGTVRTAIENEAPPSVALLVELISKIELPKATPPPGEGGAGTDVADALDTLNSFGLASQQRIDAENSLHASDRQITLALGLLSQRVDILSPEFDLEIVNGMTACVAKLSDS